MADRFWVGASSTSFNNSANWSLGSGGSGGASIPTDTDTAIYDANSSADCVLDIDRTLNILKVESGFTRVITSSSSQIITIQQHMEINRASCFAFTSGNIITFTFDKSESPVSAFDGSGSSFSSGDIYIKYGANTSVFFSETARSNCVYNFSANQSVVLVDGVYPNIISGGILFAKYITADSSATDFNTYGSVDILQYRTNGTGTVRSTSHDIHDYDKEFFFESIHSSGIGEFFQFGHTTARFKSGTSNFRLPVFGDVYTNFGNTTTNTFNVQYHKVVIDTGDNLTNYAFIQNGKTLECNELVIRDGGRLYGPAEGLQVASAKIKSVKRPTVQGDWNFKQIADGIYESIGNIPTLPVTEGGTGLNTLAVGRIPFGNGQLPLQTLSTLNYNTSSNTLNAVNAHFTGKLTVDGLIDPTGMEFTAVGSNPGTDQAKTIWVNSGDSNKLYFGSSEVGGGGGISLNGSTANGILTFGNSTTADVEANITASGATLSINNPSGNGSIELGGSAGGFIDLKGPFGNDKDLRIRTTGTGGTISTDSNADLGIDVGTGTVNVTGALDVSSGISGEVQPKATTVAAGSNTSNHYAKLLTFNPGGQTVRDCNLILGVTAHDQGNSGTAIISVKFRSNGATEQYTGDVAFMSKTGTSIFDNDAFQIFSDGNLVAQDNNTNMELWVKKSSNFSALEVHEISKAITGGSATLTYHTDSAWQSSAPTNNAFTTTTQGIELNLNVVATGNVGIGTTSASTPLHIRSTTTTLDNLLTLENNGASGAPGVGIKMFSNVGTQNYLEILHDAFGATNFKTVNGSDTYNKQVHLQSDGDVSFEAGDVGIGTSTPSGNLHVVGATGDAGRIYLSDADNGTAAGDSLLITKSGTNAFVYNRDSGDLRLGSNNNANFVTIDSNGRVGVGTTAPDSLLHVTSETSGDAIVIIEADSDNNNSDGSDNDTPQIWFKADGGINEGALRLNNNHLELISNVGAIGSIKLMTGTTDNTGSTDPGTGATVRLQIAGSGAITFNNAYTFPTADGGANATLTTDGSGSLAFRDMTYHRKPVVYMADGGSSSGVTVNTSAVTIPFNNEILDPSNNASSTTTGHIRLAHAGYYKVSYSVPIEDDAPSGDSNPDRTRIFTFMETDDNDSFSSATTVAQSRSQVYTRENSGGSGLSTTFIYQHTLNDYIRIRVQKERGTSISTEDNQSQISIEYIGPA